ncbi:MAG: zinc ribbon domain-containing protein [Betaproteobacteria bacterium]|nr:zinc ribbon domain-containing protein [Betaproteobacteria bacterium]
MPIYAYKCESCGFTKDVLQKISDPLLTQCPACHQESFQKQLTAAGFQLKGSGWYVTDFRDGNKATVSEAGGADSGKPAGSDGAADGAKSETKSETKSEVKTDSKTTSSTESKATTPAPKSDSGSSSGTASTTS